MEDQISNIDGSWDFLFERANQHLKIFNTRVGRGLILDFASFTLFEAKPSDRNFWNQNCKGRLIIFYLYYFLNICQKL